MGETTELNNTIYYLSLRHMTLTNRDFVWEIAFFMCAVKVDLYNVFDGWKIGIRNTTITFLNPETYY